MPIISRFFGIVVFMFWRDHDPPHFHAKYGDQEAIIEIETGNVRGQLSRRALNLVQEWRMAHKNELLQNWKRAKNNQPLLPIKPLE